MTRVAGVSVVVALVVFGTVWLVVDRGSPEGSAAAELAAVTAPVERRTLRDVVVLRGSLEGRSLPALLAVGDGRVTDVRVTAGSAVNTGDVLFDVHGEPVVAVEGEFPYWRDLAEGDTGPDVAQLEAALEAEGLSPGTVDERFTASTRRAVQEWQRQHGLPDDGAFRAGRVLVAPWPVRIDEVGVSLGASVTPDTELLAVSSLERVGNFTVSAVDRSRLEVGQSVEVTPADGGAALAGSVTAVASAPIQDLELNEPRYEVVVELDEDPEELDDGTALRADVVIAEVEDVLVVPVAAVGTGLDGEAVVIVEGGEGDRRQVPVTLGLQEAGYVEVASGLGGDEQVVLELE